MPILSAQREAVKNKPHKGARPKAKLQRQLGALRDKNGHGCCWVCGSAHGVKTSREGYGTRCKQCVENNKTNDDVTLYEQLKAQLAA